MKSKQQLDEDEEKIRIRVRALSDEQRLIFFSQTEKRLKDPDTYAALNFFFITGLHHFYLEKNVHGTINVVVFLLGVIVIITGHYLIGSLIILIISAIELGALFQAQCIIQAYNNDVMEKIYQDLIEENEGIKKQNA